MGFCASGILGESVDGSWEDFHPPPPQKKRIHTHTHNVNLDHIKLVNDTNIVFLEIEVSTPQENVNCY